MPRAKEFEPDQALARAMELFWEKGYEATSVQDLVEHMGINRFSLYDTFGSKHELFMAALDRYSDEIVTAALCELEGAEKGVAAIRGYFKAAVGASGSSRGRRGCLMTNSAVEMAPHDEQAAEKVRAHLERLENALYRQLLKARKDGELGKSQNLRDLALFLTGAAQGLGVMMKAGQDRSALEGYVSVVLSALE